MLDQAIDRLPSLVQEPARILGEAAEEYGKDRASRMAAAISYRTIFALAPLLLIVVAVMGAFIGSRAEAADQIIDAIETVVGPEVAQIVDSILANAFTGVGTAAVVGVVLLVWTASSLFLEMQRDLNDIFEVPREKVAGPVAMVRTRGIGFLWVFGLGVVLMAAWFLNATWRFLANLLPDWMESAHGVIAVLTPLLSLLLIPVVFGLIFQTMVARKLPWRAVRVGATFTAAVFLAASYGLGLYFQWFEPTTALGFAGSFVVILFLAYFLSMVFLFGAEVTKVYEARLVEREAPPRRTPIYTDPQVLVAVPEEGLPRTALLGFLAGLAVAWRRSRR